MAEASAVIEGRKGGVAEGEGVVVEDDIGKGVDWEKTSRAWVLVSRSRIAERAVGCSQGGVTMSARRWRFRRSASQRGSVGRWGGRWGGVAPWIDTGV